MGWRGVIVVLSLCLLAACAPTLQSSITADERVAEFLTAFPDAAYAEARYDDEAVHAISDVLTSDCPDEESRPLVRATFTSRAATLIAYADLQTRKVFCVSSRINDDALTVQQGDPSTVPEGTLFTVNDEPITREEFESALGQLPEAVQSEERAGAVAAQLINNKLLSQAARELPVAEEEVAATIERISTDAGYESPEGFKAGLVEEGTTYEDLVAAVADALRVQRYLQERGVFDVEVDEEELKELYLQNTGQFIVGEQVRFRQLFIANRGDNAAAEERMRSVLAAIRDGQEFCALVRERSDDRSSRERCGEYVAGRGVMEPTIEAALFSLAENQTTVIESPSGFHFFIVLERTDAGVLPYPEAASMLREALVSEAAQQRLSLLLLSLRAQAEIVDYS